MSGEGKMRTVEFSLSMPSNNAWNGRWTGEGRGYYIFKNLTDKKCEELELPNSWYHNFGDGWCACIKSRILDKGEKKRKSVGFCGYEWMVSDIMCYGKIGKPELLTPQPER